MPKTRILTLFVLILSVYCHAQNQNNIGQKFDSIHSSSISDSLKVVAISALIQQAPNANDSLLGAIQHRLGLLHYRLKDNNNALLSTQKAIIFRASPGQEPSLKHNSQYNLSFYYNALGDTKKRVQVLNQLVSDQNPDKFTYRSLIELGYYYSDLGDYFKSLQSFEMVVNGFDIHNDNRTLVLGNMGLIYVLSLMESQELTTHPYQDHINKIVGLSEHATPAQLASCNTNIGRLYETLEEYSLSETFYNKALHFYEDSKDQEMTAILLNNLGSVWAKDGKIPAAVNLFEEGLSMSIDYQTRAVLFDNLGYYSAANNVKKAQHSILRKQ